MYRYISTISTITMIDGQQVAVAADGAAASRPVVWLLIRPT